MYLITDTMQRVANLERGLLTVTELAKLQCDQARTSSRSQHAPLGCVLTTAPPHCLALEQGEEVEAIANLSPVSVDRYLA